MRLYHCFLVTAYLVLFLSLVFACPEFKEEDLDKERPAKCSVGQSFVRNCIWCRCVRTDVSVCSRIETWGCGSLPARGTKLCFKPQKLKLHMSQSLSSSNLVESQYQELANLARNCEAGKKIIWKKCKGCDCTCVLPGVASCRKARPKIYKDSPISVAG